MEWTTPFPWVTSRVLRLRDHAAHPAGTLPSPKVVASLLRRAPALPVLLVVPPHALLQFVCPGTRERGAPRQHQAGQPTASRLVSMTPRAAGPRGAPTYHRSPRATTSLPPSRWSFS